MYGCTVQGGWLTCIRIGYCEIFKGVFSKKLTAVLGALALCVHSFES